MNILHMVEALRPLLPTQGPLQEFVHHNTLHAYIDRDFHDATVHAGAILGAKSYFPLATYVAMYHSGEIKPETLAFVWKEFYGDRCGIAFNDLFDCTNDVFSQSRGILREGVRTSWDRKVDLNLDTQSVLIRILSSYLDQGQAHWHHDQKFNGFLEYVSDLIETSFFPLVPLSKRVAGPLLRLKPEEIISFCLDKLLADQAMAERYLAESLLLIPGWAGFVSQIELQPSLLKVERKITVAQFIAVLLLIDYSFLLDAFGAAQLIPRSDGSHVAKFSIPKSAEMLKLRIWHEAFEWNQYLPYLSALKAKHASQSSPTKKPRFQAMFCLDERLESLRRYLEDICPSVETYGVPGFFGIDCFIGSTESSPIQKYAPLPVEPKHLIINKLDKSAAENVVKSRRHSGFSSRSLLRGWLHVQLLGLFSGFRILVGVFFPHYLEKRKLKSLRGPSELFVLSESGSVDARGLQIGFSFEDAAKRVAGLLKTINLVEDFSQLVFVVGHGASSVNNPYFAAYDCGACSGKPGALNARAFCIMANHPKVRLQLKVLNIDIPPETKFVPGLFDTTADEIDFYHLSDLNAEQMKSFQEFRVATTKALDRNARERCRRFELAGRSLSVVKAKKHVLKRATALYEPRPEYNHATNFMTIVGRRSLTREIFLDRRSFLQSYDPATDPSGSVLAAVLSAVVPVCGGINLEYFYSRIDSNVYGAGSKLPQNVVGLFGVMTGIESDLRTGLPLQMTEIHDPVRLMIVIEQEPNVVEGVIHRTSQIRQWIENDWVRVLCLPPMRDQVFVFQKSSFRELKFPEAKIAVLKNYESVIANEYGNLQPVFLGG